MERVVIRINIESIELEGMVALKKALDELLKEYQGVTIEIVILPKLRR